MMEDEAAFAAADTAKAENATAKTENASAKTENETAKTENDTAKAENDTAVPKTVYVDGVFDLFHTGHLAFLRKARETGGEGARLLAGVITDEDAGWKRRPFIPHAQRVAMLRACRLVDEVVAKPPLVLTEAFLDAHGITRVVHGDDDLQEKYFGVAIARGIMRYVPYERESPYAVSTSELVARVRARPAAELRTEGPP